MNEFTVIYMITASSIIGLLLALCSPHQPSAHKAAKYSRKKGERHDD